MDPSDNDRRFYLVSAGLCLLLAILFSCLVARVGYIVVVDYFGQDKITFWVAMAIAILIWFIEEMLHLTLPCRRALRRAARWLAERWIELFKRERKACSQSKGRDEARRIWPTRELIADDPQRRLAYWLAERWIERLKRERKDSGRMIEDPDNIRPIQTTCNRRSSVPTATTQSSLTASRSTTVTKSS